MSAGGGQGYSGGFGVNGGADTAKFANVPGGYDDPNTPILYDHANPNCSALAKSPGGHLHATDGCGVNTSRYVRAANTNENAVNGYDPAVDSCVNNAGEYIQVANRNLIDANAYVKTIDGYGNAANLANAYNSMTNAYASAMTADSNTMNAYSNVMERYDPAKDVNGNTRDTCGDKAGRHVQAGDGDENMATMYANANTQRTDTYANTVHTNAM